MTKKGGNDSHFYNLFPMTAARGCDWKPCTINLSVQFGWRFINDKENLTGQFFQHLIQRSPQLNKLQRLQDRERTIVFTKSKVGVMNHNHENNSGVNNKTFRRHRDINKRISVLSKRCQTQKFKARIQSSMSHCRLFSQPRNENKLYRKERF